MLMMLYKLSFRILALFSLFLLPGLAAAQDFVTPTAQSASRIAGNVQIVGTQRVDPATVLSYMTIKPGDRYNRDALSHSMKALYDTGLFADISMQEKGSTLVVQVVENPLISQVVFEGNKRIDDETLAGEVRSRARSVLNRSVVQEDVDRIYEIYRRSGRFSVNVEAMMIPLDQNRVNLAFEISEGDVSEISSIRFVGNRAYDDDDLRGAILSQETRWYRFLSTNDRYDPDRLDYDQELLRRFYLKNGYVDFSVVSAVAELSPEKDSFYVTFTVDEGERYKVGAVNVDAAALDGVDPSVLSNDVSMESGDWYNADEIDEVVDEMTDTLGNMQYAFVEVRPSLKRNIPEREVDILFRVNPTQRVFVDRINITGNVRTIDKVIRREMELLEGDAFNRTKLAKSENNIRDMDFFETVTVKPVRGATPDQTEIDVTVEEKSTGDVSIGAGFSTQDGPLADLRIRERNLLGKGQELVLGTTIAGERTQFDLAFTEPYFLDRDLRAGIDVFHTTRDLQDESSYDLRNTGGGFRFGYGLSRHWSQSWRYRLEKTEIENVGSDASRFIQDQEGTRTKSSVAQRLVYDLRDSKLSPSEGYFLWLDSEFAGLGGDVEFVSGKTGGSFYYPIADEVVLNILGEVGAIEAWGSDDEVQINDRYFMGGNTLRGFENAGIGPRDLSTDDALGGNRFYRGSAEVSFPFGLYEEFGIKGHGFADVGSLWDVDDSAADVVDDDALRASVGAGISWRSPIGPIRLDFATPVKDESYDDDELFRFSFGTRF